MRRRAAPFLLSLAGMIGVLAATPTQLLAQSRAQRPPATASQSGPPHAWLFGVWTGGLFPVLDGMLAQDCKTQTTVFFTRDVVGHTSLIGASMSQRVIETVRTAPAGAEFRFSPNAADADSFGCADPDTLHVLRTSQMQISFPGCSTFPYPLQRCPTPG